MSELALPGIAQQSVVTTATKRTSFQDALVADVLFGTEGYAELHADWQRLASLQNGTVLFQTPALLTAWARRFARGRSGSLATLVVRHDERSVLIWPLFVERRGLFRVASGAGVPIAQYDDVLVDPDYDPATVFKAALDMLADTIRPDVVSLERVRADSALRTALNGTTPLSWAEGAPYADLSGGMEGIWSTRKPRVVRQQKKRVRSLSRKGDVAFHVAANAQDAEEWLTEALALKRDWLLSTGRVSRAFMRPETTQCLIDLAQTMSAADAPLRVVVAKLTHNGRTAALEVGFCHRDTYHLYLGAYHPDLAKLGPGNVLTEKVLEWCFAAGLTRYDMLAPRSRNKREWQSGEVAVVDFALPLTLGGRLYAALVLKRLGPAMRDAFYALPPRTRSFIARLALRL